MANMLRWTDAQLAAHRVRVIPAAPVANLSGQERMRALGRLKTGEMNKTEAAYGLELERRKIAGEILWYKFEGIKLRLADKTFLTVDYAVMLSDGGMELHEVKGFMEDDANVKLKVAASMYPFVFKLIKKAKGGAWQITEI